MLSQSQIALQAADFSQILFNFVGLKKTLLHKETIYYALLLAVLLFLLNAVQYRVMLFNYPMEILLGLIALLFLGLGVWLAGKFRQTSPQPQVGTEPVQNSSPDPERVIKSLGLTIRELEVLQLMSQGLSNQEIGDHLHISLPTVKTHTSNLYEKLGVKRRTQAVNEAKLLKIIP